VPVGKLFPSAGEEETDCRGTEGLRVDLSIFRVRLGSGRAEKISVSLGRKNSVHNYPTRCNGPQFSGQARARPGLGRAAHAFYSAKQLKQHFGPAPG
jgi:hypothetical protein